MAPVAGASAAAALLLLLLAPRSEYEPGVLLAAHRQPFRRLHDLPSPMARTAERRVRPLSWQPQ